MHTVVFGRVAYLKYKKKKLVHTAFLSCKPSQQSASTSYMRTEFTQKKNMYRQKTHKLKMGTFQSFWPYREWKKKCNISKKTQRQALLGSFVLTRHMRHPHVRAGHLIFLHNEEGRWTVPRESTCLTLDDNRPKFGKAATRGTIRAW